MTRKIKLPAFYEDHANHYADTALALESNPKNPKKRFEELKYEFLKNAYEESITPHMNPSTPVAEGSFPEAISKEFLATERVPGEGVILNRQFRGAVITLTSMMTRKTMGLARVSKKETYEAGRGTAEDKGLNQIKRAAVAAFLVHVVWRLFQSDGKKIAAAVEAQFKDMSYSQMSQQEFRKKLGEQVLFEVNEAMKNIDFADLIVQAVQKVHPPASATVKAGE